MTATYWIAKYVEDPFRNEPKNVGVIVALNGIFSAKFMGEKDDGSFDGRKVSKAFAYPAVYTQWRTFWRSKIARSDINAIVKSITPNYYVQASGEVSETGSDRAVDVCNFLYNLLVGSGPIEAYDWADEEDVEADLASDIISAMQMSAVLATGSQLFARHPVITGQSINGRHVAHTPSFSQRNGRLYVMEHIDLTARRINKTKERAGWMAYMFADIKDYEKQCEAYSIIRPENENGAEQIAYAKAVLAGESTIVNWTDDGERTRFLEDRRRIAEPGLHTQ